MILSALLRISLPILLGYALKKIRYFPEEHYGSVQLFCIRVATPALIFMSLYTADMSTVQQFLPVSLSVFLFSGIGWLIAVGGTALFRIRRHRAEIILILIFNNVGYIGWAVLNTILGDGGLRRGIFISSFWMPNLYLYSILTLLVCGGDGSLKGEGRRIAVNLLPALAAVFLGLGLNLGGLKVHGDLIYFFNSFGDMTVSLILFTVGMSISVRDSIADLRRLLPLTFIRTALSFCAISLTILILPMLDETSRKSLYIETVMPVATGNLIMSHVFGLDNRFVSSAIALSTLVSFVTIPVMVGIFTS
ncbi:MAG: AEC family transporter [Spirochaetales bacterium]|nr:AEC family transporter [Spirochaetales bacterium]